MSAGPSGRADTSARISGPQFFETADQATVAGPCFSIPSGDEGLAGGGDNTATLGSAGRAASSKSSEICPQGDLRLLFASPPTACDTIHDSREGTLMVRKEALSPPKEALSPSEALCLSKEASGPPKEASRLPKEALSP